MNIVRPWVQKFYPVLRLGSGGKLRRFQTPVLYWINFCLRIAACAEFVWPAEARNGSETLFPMVAFSCSQILQAEVLAVSNDLG